MFSLPTAHLVLFATSLLRNVRDGIIDKASELPGPKLQVIVVFDQVQSLSIIINHNQSPYQSINYYQLLLSITSLLSLVVRQKLVN